MSQANTTTDHKEIRAWIEARGGRPTVVRGTEGRDGEGILRVDFREPDEKLEEIDWDTFFKTFDDRDLAFLHQDKTADGHESRFFKFVHRSEHTSKNSAGKGSAGKDSGARKSGGQEHAASDHGSKRKQG